MSETNPIDVIAAAVAELDKAENRYVVINRHCFLALGGTEEEWSNLQKESDEHD